MLAALVLSPALLLRPTLSCRPTLVLARAPGSLLLERLPSEDERRERLRLLFGDDSLKIAERTLAMKTSAEAPAAEVQMLIEGMQPLDWGAVRLVDVDKAPGPLEASFEPLLKKKSQLLSVRLDLPLGMLLEEDAAGESVVATVVVAELLEGGSAREGGLQVGDLLRATTAMSMAMSYPTWNLLLGGVGRPSFQKVLLTTEGEPFEKIMQALGSNSVEAGGNGQVVLFIERAVAS